MRTLKIQTQMTLDGYMAGPAGEQDWMLTDWTPDVGQYVTSIMEGVDEILLGRVLAEGFIPFWTANPEMDGAEFFVSTPKTVLTSTLDSSPWENTRVVSGDLAETIGAIKDSEGGDLIAYGGGRFVSGLVRAGLVDELHVMVNPTAIGSGMPLFGASEGASDYLRFDTVAVHPFECGVTAHHLAPRRG